MSLMPSKRAAVEIYPAFGSRVGHVAGHFAPIGGGAVAGETLVRPRSRPLDHRKLAGQAAFFTSGARWNRTIDLSIISAAL